MTINVFIDGAAGTTGLEIAERLAGRAGISLIALDEASRKSEAARRDAYHAADFAILCLPDEAARAAVVLAQGSRVRIIDASSAHRVADGWTYGFPELVGREAVAGAARVSNPGCYPTGFLALIAPVVRAGMLPADWPYSVHAVSGYSGGGKAMIARFARERDIGFRAYALGMGHKHIAEMQVHGGLTRPPLFSPAVVAAQRGMVVEVPLPLDAIAGAGGAGALRAELARFYAGSALVRVHEETPDEILLREDAAGWDGVALYLCGSADGTQARAIAVLDNLGKGASGAAVQNLNLMAGLPEMAGLRV